MSLLLHCKGRTVEKYDVFNSPTPMSTESHVKIPHGICLDFILKETQARMPYAQFIEQQFALQDGPHPTEKDHDGKPVIVQEANFYAFMKFGLDTFRKKDESWSFAMVVRNSHIKRFQLEAAVAAVAHACDNVTVFGGKDATHAKAKHTRNGWEQFDRKFTRLLRGAEEEFATATQRIEKLQETQICDGDAAELILRGQHLNAIEPKESWHIFQQWKRYADKDHRYFDSFGDRNCWSLQNAMTEVIKPSVLSGDQLRGEGLFQTFESWLDEERAITIVN